MTSTSIERPYSKLPEIYFLAASLAWLDLVVASWPGAPTGSLWVCALVLAALLAGASMHSWYVARPYLWLRDRTSISITVFWLLIAATAALFVESHSGWTMVGLLAFVQVVICSFIVGHKTLRLSLGTSLVVMLALTLRLPLFEAGVFWVVFVVLSVFLLAYDRTARLAGPSGFARGERRDTASRVGAASLVALTAAFLFLLTPVLQSIDLGLPKIGSSPTPVPDWTIPEMAEQLGYGFSDIVDTASPQTPDMVVMNLETVPVVNGPLYVRGRSFNTFNGTNWSQARTGQEKTLFLDAGERSLVGDMKRVSPARSDSLTQVYRMNVSMPEVVFSVGRPEAIDFGDPDIAQLTLTPDGVMRVEDELIEENTGYTVKSKLDRPSEEQRNRIGSAGSIDARDLSVPAGMENVGRRAREVTKGYYSNYTKARVIESHLRANYRYSLDHDVTGAGMLDKFLFGKERKGHCAIFASAMVMMCRSVDVPARYVTGFLAQTPSRSGFQIRGSDGHAWVEVLVPEVGWVTFDPTSPNNVPGEGIARTPDRTAPPINAEDLGGLNGRDDMPEGGAGGAGNPDRAAGNNGRGNGPDRGTGGRGWDGAPIERPDSGGEGIARGGGENGDSGRPTTPDGTDGGTAGSRGGGEAGPKPGIVDAPGGSTQLPRRSTGEAGSESSNPAPSREQNKDEKAADWRWLVATISVVGVVGLFLLLLWRLALKPVIEKQQVREAMPLVVDDDPDPRRFIVKLYDTMVAGFGKIGLERKEGETPTEFAETIAVREPRLEPSVGELTELFQQARYNDAPVTATHASRARSLWGSIARTVDRVHPRPDESSGD